MEDVSHILPNSGFSKENREAKEVQCSAHEFYQHSTNPLWLTWINSANINLGSAGADENSDSTESRRRNNSRAGGSSGVQSTSVRATASHLLQGGSQRRGDAHREETG